MLFRAVSVLPDAARSSFGQFRALWGTFGLRPRLPEDARRRPKAELPEAARSCAEQPRASIEPARNSS
eukprot:13614918-Alexandrium_andersonii.AAC.1